jgi:thiamine kinase-like enzyme
MNVIEINEKYLSLIKKAMQIAFSTDSWSVVEKINRGMTESSIYKIQINGKFCIARISDPEHPHNNLEREYQSMRIAFDSGVSPVVYYTDFESGIVIMDYVTSSVLTLEDMKKQNVIKNLSSVIRQLHHGKEFQDCGLIFRRVAMVHENLPIELKKSRVVKLAMGMKEEIQESLDDANDLKPAHADLNPYNILFNGETFKLVDWATAAQESFYFDLATCAIFYFYRKNDLEESFLESYFDRELDLNEKAKFYLMKVFVSIYYGVLFLFTSCTESKDFLSESEIYTLPEYSQFMELISEDNVDLSDPVSRQKMGFVFLKKAETEIKDEAFAVSLSQLEKISAQGNTFFRPGM